MRRTTRPGRRPFRRRASTSVLDGLREEVEHRRPAVLVLRARFLPALAETLPPGVLELDDGRAALRAEAHLDLRHGSALLRAGMPREGDPGRWIPREDLAPHRLLAALRPLDDPLALED